MATALFVLLVFSFVPLVFRSLFCWAQLFPIDGERQQDVARNAAEPGVSRVDKQHPTADGHSRAIQRSTCGADAVYGLIVANRVEVPKDFAFFGGIGAQVAIE